jgi:hypothetical protein
MSTVAEIAIVTDGHSSEELIVNECPCAGANGNGRGDTPAAHDNSTAPEDRQGDEVRCDNDSALDSLCRSLQSLERQRRFALKQCIRGENAITAFVAWNACGFHTGIPSEAEREKLWKKAGKLIKEIDSGECIAVTEDGGADGESGCATEGSAAQDEIANVTEVSVVQDEVHRANDDANVQDDADDEPRANDCPVVQNDSGGECHIDTEPRGVAGVVRISQISRKAWANYEVSLMEEMKRLAGELPVAPWLSTDECRGISLGMLATIVGEAGNISNYPNPAKLWRRLFGAPITKDGKTMMPSRWRLEKGLSAEEWEEAGYSPQRHATMQQMKENIVRQNGDGPYRRRYDEAKERTRETHPEWWQCGKCEGKGKVGRKKCQNCKGSGEVALHAHRHAQLLAAKRFVRDLWNKWHDEVIDTDDRYVPRCGV